MHTQTIPSISRTHIEIIDPPKKFRLELKTKNNPGTRHGNEFGATLTSCVATPDDPAELPSLAVPESDSDGNNSLTPFISFGQFAADPLKCFKELRMFLFSGTTPRSLPSSSPH
jgi:hypothetical protein